MITANEARTTALNSITFRELKQNVDESIRRASKLHHWSCGFVFVVPEYHEMITKSVCALIVELKRNGFEVIKRSSHKRYNDNGDYVACDIQIKW